MTDSLFYTAKKLIEEERNYTVACPLLEESFARCPAIGIKYALAFCYENTGRPASAWALYRDVLSDAEATNNAPRAKQAREGEERTTAMAPYLRLAFPSSSAAELSELEIELDKNTVSKPQWGVPIPVDWGKHQIIAHAPGKLPWELTVRIEAPQRSVVVKIPSLQDPPWPARRAVAVSLITAGVSGIVLGLVMGGVALVEKHQYDEDVLREGCPRVTLPRCPPLLVAKGNMVTWVTNASATGFVAGGALSVGGLVVWRNDRQASNRETALMQISPTFQSSGAGLRLEGAF